MPGYTLSRLAVRDLNEIANYTCERWGAAQAIEYVEGLRALCRKLAETPAIGRECDDVRAGLRRMEGSRHVIFFRVKAGGIVVSRILHQTMLPGLHQQ